MNYSYWMRLVFAWLLMKVASEVMKEAERITRQPPRPAEKEATE